jgi:hypothetical protein
MTLACGTAGGRKVAASPAPTNTDTDTVGSVTDANISPAIAMIQAVTVADHPDDR